jgi:hypothetical protein
MVPSQTPAISVCGARFRAESDRLGSPWAPLAVRDDERQTLGSRGQADALIRSSYEQQSAPLRSKDQYTCGTNVCSSSGGLT